MTVKVGFYDITFGFYRTILGFWADWGLWLIFLPFKVSYFVFYGTLFLWIFFIYLYGSGFVYLLWMSSESSSSEAGICCAYGLILC